MRSDFDHDWRRLSDEVLSGLKEWRLAHPRATLREIEAALDERLVGLRARLLADAAMASVAAEWEAGAEASAPVCPTCSTPLKARGVHERELQTQGGQTLSLSREYGVCPTCGGGLFPPG